MDKKDAGLIGLGIAAAGGIGTAIALGIQNRKLRKQIEMLHAVVANLDNEIGELKKEMKALKLFSFERKRLQEQITFKEQQKRDKIREIKEYEKELKKAS
jgi:seryl-tRNA synthetase